MSASEVTPQFVIRLFPLTESLGRRWQAGGQTERVKQPVERKSLQIFLIGLGRRTKGWSFTFFMENGLTCGAITSWSAGPAIAVPPGPWFLKANARG